MMDMSEGRMAQVAALKTLAAQKRQQARRQVACEINPAGGQQAHGDVTSLIGQVIDHRQHGQAAALAGVDRIHDHPGRIRGSADGLRQTGIFIPALARAEPLPQIIDGGAGAHAFDIDIAIAFKQEIPQIRVIQIARRPGRVAALAWTHQPGITIMHAKGLTEAGSWGDHGADLAELGFTDRFARMQGDYVACRQQIDTQGGGDEIIDQPHRLQAQRLRNFLFDADSIEMSQFGAAGENRSWHRQTSRVRGKTGLVLKSTQQSDQVGESAAADVIFTHQFLRGMGLNQGQVGLGAADIRAEMHVTRSFRFRADDRCSGNSGEKTASVRAGGAERSAIRIQCRRPLRCGACGIPTHKRLAYVPRGAGIADMPPAPHRYTCDLRWTGAEQGPATDPKTFSRAFSIDYGEGKLIHGSADPNFLGDRQRLNPEELLLGAVASCHLLTWVYLAARHGVGVVTYADRPEATLSWIGDTFAITAMTLHPRIILPPGADRDKADALHADAHRQCFIARSVNFPIEVQATYG